MIEPGYADAQRALTHHFKSHPAKLWPMVPCPQQWQGTDCLVLIRSWIDHIQAPLANSPQEIKLAAVRACIPPVAQVSRGLLGRVSPGLVFESALVMPANLVSWVTGEALGPIKTHLTINQTVSVFNLDMLKLICSKANVSLAQVAETLVSFRSCASAFDLDAPVEAILYRSLLVLIEELDSTTASEFLTTFNTLLNAHEVLWDESYFSTLLDQVAAICS